MGVGESLMKGFSFIEKQSSGTKAGFGAAAPIGAGRSLAPNKSPLRGGVCGWRKFDEKTKLRRKVFYRKDILLKFKISFH